MIENYTSILEKTNQQLSLWSNPYGLMVGILTLLVAVGAIVVSIILLKNSREQKQIQKEFFEEQERIINEKNEREDKLRKEHYEKAEKQFEEIIKEQQAKLATTNKEGKQAIEKEIEELKKQKATLGLNKEPSKVFLENSSVFSPKSIFLGSDSGSKKMFCSQCGQSFEYYEENNNPYGFVSGNYSVTNGSFIGLGGNNKRVHCSYCNALNVPK